MRKHILAAFIVLVMLSPAALSASENSIFSGWEYAGDTIVANDIVFSYSWAEDVDSIRLRYDSYYKNLDKGSCEILKGTNNTIKACYDKNEYDMTKRVFRAYLILYSLEPDIDIIRKFNATDIIVTEPVRVDVNISNNGASAAYNLHYEDNLENFEITECENCYIERNSAVWRDSALDAGETEQFSYYIRPKEKFDRVLAAVLKYNTLRTSEEITTNTVHVTVDHILSIRTKLVDYNYFAGDTDDLIESGKDYTKKEGAAGFREIKGSELDEIITGDSLKVIIELTNNKYNPDDNKPIKINNLEIIIPKHFGKVSESNIKASYNRTQNKTTGSIGIERISPDIYTWSGWINDYRKFFVLSMRAELSGHPSIYVSSEFESENNRYSTDIIKDTIEIINVSPKVQVAFEKRDPGTRYYTRTEYLEDEYQTEANKKEIMKIRVTNPSTKVKLENIDIILDSEIFAGPLVFRVDDLVVSGSKLLDVIEFNIPHVTRDKRFPFYINLSWRTEFGEKFSETLEKEIKVESIKDMIISQKLSDSSVDSGKEFSVTVQIENKRPTPVYNVTVSDNITGFILKSGVTSQRVDIKEKTKIDAYRYILIAPEVRNKTKKCFNTTVNYISGSSEYIISKEKCVIINPRRIDLRIEEKITDSEVFIGEIFGIDYKITNKDEKSAFDIWFNLPLQKYFDLVSEYAPITAARLDEDEIWNIKDTYKARAKREGKFTLEPIILFYKDKEGNEFSKPGKKKTINIENQSINSPMLIISKDISNQKVLTNQTLDVILSVENIGIGFASNITIWDYGKEWKLQDIGTHDIKTIRYNISFDNTGEYDLGQARMYYYDGSWNYLTASEQAGVSIIEKAPAEEEEIITIAEEKLEEEVKEKRPLVDRIIDFILKILFWKRGG